MTSQTSSFNSKSKKGNNNIININILVEGDKKGNPTKKKFEKNRNKLNKSKTFKKGNKSDKILLLNPKNKNIGIKNEKFGKKMKEGKVKILPQKV